MDKLCPGKVEENLQLYCQVIKLLAFACNAESFAIALFSLSACQRFWAEQQ